ncbi:MAG: iron-sulfur cluster assembly scaffold protein [Caldimicrobium sp.]
MQKYYGKKVLQEFLQAKNIGEIEEADIVIIEENPICTADSPPSPCLLKLYLKIEEEKIIDAKFKLQGCVAAIAMLSKLTEKLKGLSLEEARNLTFEEFLKDFEYGIPENKRECTLINLSFLKKFLKV